VSLGTCTLDLAPLERTLKGMKIALIKAGNRAAKPLKAAVVREVGSFKRYGFLEKSIGTKTRVYDKSGLRVFTAVGPKMSFERFKGVYSRGPRKGQKRKHIPYLYSWLTDRGTKRSKRYDWLTKARDSVVDTAADGIVAEVKAAIIELSAGGTQ
jgi:hypothetical protein